MNTSRSGWVRLAVVVVFLIAGGTGSLHAATITWDGDGDPDNDGNWSTAANWSDNGDPAGDTITLPDVDGNGNSGNSTRTITVDSAYSANALTISQTTSGFTNKLVLAANLSLPQPNNVAFGGTGPIVVDIGNKQLSAFGGATTRNYGQNITWYSSGGTFLDTWNGSSTLFNLQGAMNLTAGTTTMTIYRGFQVDTTGVLNLTGSATLHFNQTTKTNIVLGTVTGDGTGSLRAFSVQFGPVSAASGLGSVAANTWDFRATDPTKFNFTGTTLKLYSGGSASPIIGNIEVMSDVGSSNYRSAALDLRGFPQSQIKLVDNHNNDPTSAGAERLMVDAFYAHNNNATDTFDLNGFELYISNSIAGYTAPASYGRIGNASGTGNLTFATAGGALSLGQIFILNGATLQVTGPASINAVDTGADTSNGAGFNGTFRFNGNVIGRFATTGSGNCAVDLGGGTLTLGTTAYNLAKASSNTRLTISGNVNNTERNAATGYGVIAAGMTKLGASGEPTVVPAATLAITGNYQLNNPTNGTGDTVGATEIGRQATMKVGGNFIVCNMHNNTYQTYNLYLWRVNTSQDAGTLVFNGGGPVQLWDLNSGDFLRFTGIDYYARSGSGLAANDTVTGGSSGATATITDVVGTDQLRLSGITGTFQADETLTFNNGHGTARAFNANYTGFASAQADNGVTRAPYGNVSIGDPAGLSATVKLTNGYNNAYYGSVETMQVARSLTVTTNSVFDIARYKMVVALGTNSTVAGLITNSVAGGTLIVTNGASLAFQTGGVIDVDTMTIASDCKVDFNKAQGSYIRVNGNQKVAFDALIAGGQIVDNGGNVVKVSYSAGDAHTTVTLASGSVLIIE